MSHNVEKEDHEYTTMLGNAGDNLAQVLLKLHGWKIILDKKNGYDFIIVKGKKRYYIEVKARSANLMKKSNRLGDHLGRKIFKISNLEHEYSDFVVCMLFTARSFSSMVIPVNIFRKYNRAGAKKYEWRINVIASVNKLDIVTIHGVTHRNHKYNHIENDWMDFNK